MRPWKISFGLTITLAALGVPLGILSTSGYGRQRLRDQMERLFACSISLICRGDGQAVRTRSLIDDHATFRWDYKQPAASALFSSEITLGYVVSGRH